MFLDAFLQFSDSQAIVATALSTNVIDLGLDRAIGAGEPMAVVFTVEVAASQTNSDEDYAFGLEVASDAAMTTDRKELGRLAFESGTPTAPALNADLLVAGYQFAIPLPPTLRDLAERYLAVRYTTAGTDETITVSAHLVPFSGIGNVPIYASGFSLT